ncbi:CAP domain-containing protein [Oribacterium sp. FC2011]|uniref:CAP domain-containing protein n=1 Tax=Oribacterium sp. FC2011 TaxID=1408311 RepID=UPI0004E237A1|nr:CAP domain-containing protein [Oribacterium sp. FC2011]
MSIIENFRMNKVTKKLFRVFTICMAVCSISAITSLADWSKTADNVWHYTYPNGTYASAGLQQINGVGYMFDAAGNMLTGWQQTASGWLYFDPISGSMAKGWKLIDGKYYCFNEQLGLLYTGCTTPDGYKVDNNGVWVDTTGNSGTTTFTTLTTKNVNAASMVNSKYVYEEDEMVYENKKYDNDDEEDEEDVEDLSDSQLYKLLTGSYKRSSDPSKNCDEDEALEKIVEYVNILRAKKGLDELEMDDDLMEAAAIRAEELTEKYSHTRPDGTKCFTVLDEIGYEARNKAENIAQGQISALDVTNSWYHSSGHRANMLFSKHTKIGVGMCEDNGRKNWVQLFSD